MDATKKRNSTFGIPWNSKQFFVECGTIKKAEFPLLLWNLNTILHFPHVHRKIPSLYRIKR